MTARKGSKEIKGNAFNNIGNTLEAEKAEKKLAKERARERKKAEKLLEKREKKEAKENQEIDSVKALRGKTPGQRAEMKEVMKSLLGENGQDIAPNYLDFFDRLKQDGLVTGPMFSRTTGEPKLKKVFTKKGREAYKFFFPKEAAYAPSLGS